jgi:hypothetical protein
LVKKPLQMAKKPPRAPATMPAKARHASPSGDTVNAPWRALTCELRQARRQAAGGQMLEQSGDGHEVCQE